MNMGMNKSFINIFYQTYADCQTQPFLIKRIIRGSLKHLVSCLFKQLISTFFCNHFDFVFYKFFSQHRNKLFRNSFVDQQCIQSIACSRTLNF